MSYDIIKETVAGQFLENQISRIQLSDLKYINCTNQNFKNYLYAFLKQKNVIIFENNDKAEEVYNFLLDFGVENINFFPAKEDFFINHNDDFIGEVEEERLKTIYSIINNQTNIIITTVEAITLPCIKFSKLSEKRISLKVDQEIEFENLSEKLSEIGYRRVSKITGKGEFCFKGETLSVFPISVENPIRINFFDNQIEDIKKFDILSGFSIETIKEIEITAAVENFISGINEKDIKIKEIKNMATQSPELVSKVTTYVDSKLEEYFTGRNRENLWFIPFVEKSYTTFLENLDPNTYHIYFDFDFSLETFQISTHFLYDYLSKQKNNGEIFNEHVLMIKDYSDVVNILQKFKIKYFTDTSEHDNEAILLRIAPIKKYFKNHKMLVNDINTAKMNCYKMYIFTGNRQRAESFQEGLQRENIYLNITDGINFNNNVVLIDKFLDTGFYNMENGELFVGVRDIVGVAAGSGKNKVLKNFFKPPQIGDYIVHEYFGIGLCQGLVKKEINGIAREYVLLSYAENAEVSLPVEQLDKIYKYSGTESAPKLSKIGSGDFTATKSRARKSINKLAFNLVELYAIREKTKGYIYDKDSDLQREIESDFEYIETMDQINAIKDIKNDMEQGKLMDRLLCGDVGFGKTEIALRAAVKTVLNSKQVVLIAPTTILARQHYRLFKNRLSKYAINVVEISRLTDKENYTRNINNIKQGLADIVIGTHRVLSQDIGFSNLGLLILDEEQRFGVGQKEKLKNLKKNINVLALSATPIPRTLNLSLMGVRDISILAEPPKNRLPIKTYIRKFDYDDIKEVIKYELERDGQIFILNNRIDELENIAAIVKNFSEKSKVVICNGQMNKNELEQNISDFFDKKANILISTSIIENGIDVPNANCLIVLDATRYGLAQLYQIRGRIGRSNIQAYAYFYYKEKEINEQARERLNTLKEFNELGSGFQIALKDLELRGAGNLLGAEQSGHIVNIGYELYCKMLDEEISKAKGENAPESINTNITVKLDTYIPENYIKILATRLMIYKEVSEIINDNQKIELINKYEKIYGSMPKEMLCLIKVAQIKNISATLGIEKIVIKDFNIHFELIDDDKHMFFLLMKQLPSTCKHTVSHKSRKIVIDIDTVEKAEENLNFYIEIIQKLKKEIINLQ